MSARDLDYAGEYQAALKERPSGTIGVLLLAIVCLLIIGLGWASWAKLDEVSRGDGRVVPSGRNQVVQSLEGGIVKEILVKAGQEIRKGEILLRIDDTEFSANLGELAAKRLTLLAQIQRLEKETAGGKEPLEFPRELSARAAQTISSEHALYTARQQSLAVQLRILDERVEQRERELAELRSNEQRLRESHRLAKEEMSLKAPLAQKGIVPRTDILKLEREIADLDGQLRTSRETVPRLEAAIREAEEQRSEQELSFRQEAQGQLSVKLSELAIVEESIRAATDRVVRTEVRAPVDGIVNSLNVNTVGEVIKAGVTLLDIVPKEDTLLIEAKIKPSDIAFVHIGQPALVKITAYDFSIYGGLEGKVDQISADSSLDEASKQIFYTVKVKTDSNRLGGDKYNLTIIPGMVASVDIITGRKSVLEFLLKPFNKARYEALRER
jgi:membrane fusion protein, adhesin transport system